MGRWSHIFSLNAARELREARVALATMFGIQAPDRIAFTLNATWAANIALKGLLKAGDHVICGSMEHNALARPLRSLERRGVIVTKVSSSPSTGLDPDAVRAAIRPSTRLVGTCHASNVSGAISPIAEIGTLCREHGISFLVDAAQTAGGIPVDVEAMRIDLLVFPGHKGLLGPMGTGGLYIAPSVRLDTIIEGGTGSESRSLEQPEVMPDRFESGTPNTPGIAGLAAGARYLLDRGVAVIERIESEHSRRLIDGLAQIPGVVVYGPPPDSPRASVITITIDGVDPADAAAILEASFGIAARGGLHCAPDAHQELGTLERGALRLSPGVFTSDEELEACIRALASIAGQASP